MSLIVMIQEISGVVPFPHEPALEIDLSDKQGTDSEEMLRQSRPALRTRIPSSSPEFPFNR